MSSTKHSPGPWKRGNITNASRIYADDGEICRVSGISNGGRWPKGDSVGPRIHARGKANARLIAAAPDLLDVAKIARYFMGCDTPCKAGVCEECDACALIKKAIKKAVGK